MDDLGGRPPAATDAVLDAARRIAARRDARWARRPLSPGLWLLLWAMRVYVVLMLAVVAVQLVRLA
jgi:hypothetical protein